MQKAHRSSAIRSDPFAPSVSVVHVRGVAVMGAANTDRLHELLLRATSCMTMEKAMECVFKVSDQERQVISIMQTNKLYYT